MPKGRVASWTTSGLRLLGSSRRRLWWTTFILVTALGGLWAVANPLFAAPDEPSHVIRAVSLDHGQLIGESVSRKLRKQLDVTADAVEVRVPAIYVGEDSTCFAFRPNATAECAHVEGSTRDVTALTTAGRHPPAYYAVVGVASWFYRPGPGTVYLMRLLSALITGAFIATAVTTLRRTPQSRLVTVGVLFAITPMVLFVGGTVNPSASEIAAALALWICGAVLVSRSYEQVDNRLLTAVGIAGCVLALSRQLGPLWIALIGLTTLGFANRASLRNVARSHWARLWAALIVACSLAQLGWNVAVGALGYTRPPNAPSDIPTPEIARFTVGAMFGRYREMIGVFGWLDTPSPTLAYVVWTAGLGFLILLAFAWATRRRLAALLIVLAATVIVPLTLESAVYGEVGGTAWQGRYTLPLAVGVPIVAAMALASTERGRQLTGRRMLIAVSAMLVVVHVLGFAQNLRRYTVGYDGEIQYWLHPEWSPPLSPLLLTIAYALVITAFVAWVLFFAAPSSPSPAADVGKSDIVSCARPSAPGRPETTQAS